MPSLSALRRSRNHSKPFASYVRHHLNFYRVHIIFFTFTPLIFSGILFACNGEFPIAYIDCLYNCVSAMTVCGLTTVNLSSLTPFQQVLLFIQMCLGSPVLVAWVMVYIRRSFFARKFRRIIKTEMARRVAAQVHAPVRVRVVPWWRRVGKALRFPRRTRLTSFDDLRLGEESPDREHGQFRLRPDMIRRMNDAPKLVDPSGWISEGQSEAGGRARDDGRLEPQKSSVRGAGASGASVESSTRDGGESLRERHLSDPGTLHQSSASPLIRGARSFHRSQTINVASQSRSPSIARTQTVEFTSTPHPNRELNAVDRTSVDDQTDEGGDRDGEVRQHVSSDRRSFRRPTMSLPRTATAPYDMPPSERRTLHRGFGGFPMPHVIISRIFSRFFPKLDRKLARTITIPRTQTIASQRGTLPPGTRPVPYISFEAVVGRNSTFESLTREQLEELGGVEYRALTALLWIVGGYHIISQLVAFIVIAPYMSIPHWHEDFVPPMLFRPVSAVWFSAFQVVSAYTNTGMSLEDTSMVPFQKAYPMIVFMIFLILAGNTAFPVFLRFEIWILSKLAPGQSRANETLHFLLDHPRRCFIYLFPSHQTWFLLAVLFILNGTDWIFFLILDIGNPAIASIPAGVRVLIGLLQATAVRAAGFGTIALSALAPAVKVLYVIMMYISVYPIAMSVRSTNVYEEKSMGVFEEDDRSSMDEVDFTPTGNRAKVWGRYLAMHMRKQLSFDMWWLSLALFLVCIIERDGLDDTNNATWFNIFSILFELVSAYGTVGMSLGIPFANYSLSGVFRPLSKLIVCLVMLRGRHRGLPVAIDRAVMLPYEFQESPHNEREDIEMNQSPTAVNGTEKVTFREPSSTLRTSVDQGADDLQRRANRLVDEEAQVAS